MGTNHGEGSIELAELIRQVRAELASAMRDGSAADELKFELGDVELDLELVVEKADKPGLKARIFVVDASYGHESKRSSTHRVKLTMQPRLPDQPDRKPLISDEPLAGEE